jgi:ATP-binding cassette, subfamily B, bacterial
MGTLGILGLDVAHGRIGAGDLAAAALALGPLTAGVLPGRDDLNIGWGAASVEAVRRLESESPLVRTAAGSAVVTGPVRLACRGMGFAYAGGSTVFESLDLDLEPGQSVALVGENGAGKTTLTALLAGLLVPERGQLLVDGEELDDESRPLWQRHVAVLFQDFAHYEATTLYDNVGYGSIEDLGDRSGVARAGASAGLQDLVSTLPAGWDTQLGPSYPGGIDLSGGQWQRVGLARALFALDHGARLLILDEPAANLDVIAETELYDHFLAMTAGVTTVIVSHRLAAVRHADRIVVLEGGRVVEDGSHDELMAQGGGYAALFDLQASRFRSGGE